MIDPKLFTVERLISTLLDTTHGNRNKWWSLCEIVPAYKAPFAKEDDRPKCVVRCKAKDEQYYHFLRYSCGPGQGHFWDMYGDDYLYPELALLALVEAPIPPSFIDINVWKEASAAERAAKEK